MRTRWNRSEDSDGGDHPDGLTNLGARDRALALAAPVLLIAVGAVGIARYHSLDQSSWSGASFGMFATIDNEDTRLIRGFVLDGVTSTAVALPQDLRRAAFEARVVPSDRRLSALATRWGAGVEGAERFRVEVWRIELERGPTAIDLVPLRSVEVDL